LGEKGRKRSPISSGKQNSSGSGADKKRNGSLPERGKTTSSTGRNDYEKRTGGARSRGKSKRSMKELKHKVVWGEKGRSKAIRGGGGAAPLTWEGFACRREKR